MLLLKTAPKSAAHLLRTAVHAADSGCTGCFKEGLLGRSDEQFSLCVLAVAYAGSDGDGQRRQKTWAVLLSNKEAANCANDRLFGC